jgi:hypothetical protein
MTEQKHLLINSRDRTAGTSVENATFVLDRPINDFSCVRVNYIQLYNTFHNVTNVNNEFLFLNAPGMNQLLYIRSIPVGHYTAASLTSVIDGILKAVDGSLSAVLDTTSNQITWTLGTYSLRQDGFSSDRLLGIRDLTVRTGTFTSTPNTTFPQAVQFFSPEIQGTDSSFYTNRNTVHMHPFLTIPLFSSFGTSNYYQPNFPIISRCETPCLQKLTIQMLDGEGKQLQNAIDYQLSLMFF